MIGALLVLTSAYSISALCSQRILRGCKSQNLNDSSYSLTWNGAGKQPTLIQEGLCQYLYCCPETHANVTWYKDGVKLYHGKGKYLIFEENPQILLITKVEIDHEGNFSCKVTSPNSTRTYWIEATVHPNLWACLTRPTFSLSPVNTTAYHGTSVTFICEGDFCDEENPLYPYRYVKWYRNGTLILYDNMERHRTQWKYRKNKRFRKIFLYITNIKDEDYNVRYTCELDDRVVVTKDVYIIKPIPTLPPDVATQKIVLGVVAAIFVLVIACTVIGWHFRLEIKLFIRNRLGKFEMRDDAEYHALVVYADRDAECSDFVINILSVHLGGELGYRLCIPEMHFIPGNAIGDEYIHNMAVSCCLLVVVTPSLLDHAWAYWIIEVALQKKLKVIFLELKPLNEVTDDTNKLHSAMLVMDKIKWQEAETTPHKKKRFFQRLQLVMPKVMCLIDSCKENYPSKI